MDTLTKPNDHWLYLWDKLHSLRLQPLPRKNEVEAILSQLPERQADENLSQWLARGRKPTSATVLGLPFKNFRFTKLAELQLKAAASGGQQYPLPEQPRTTPDNKLRFTLTQEGDQLRVHIKTLALATAKYRLHHIGIAASDNANSLLLVIKLDGNGEGSQLIADSSEARKVLCVNPLFALIEADDAH